MRYWTRRPFYETRNLIFALTASAGLFVTGALAQHEEHHKDQTTPPAEKSETAKPNMMSGQMMSNMHTMMMGQNNAGKLVDQLLSSFAAIQAEKDPASLKQKLATHEALLKELQAKTQSQSHMMDMMQHMMSGSMMGNSDGSNKK